VAHNNGRVASMSRFENFYQPGAERAYNSLLIQRDFNAIQESSTKSPGMPPLSIIIPTPPPPAALSLSLTLYPGAGDSRTRAHPPSP
jgi:hypothetical protein